MVVSREIEGCQYWLEVRKQRERKRERKVTVEAGNKDPIKVLCCAQQFCISIMYFGHCHWYQCQSSQSVWMRSFDKSCLVKCQIS